MVWKLIFFIASSYGAEIVCQNSIQMGTDFKICVYAEPSERLNATQDIQFAFKELERINSWMSDWQEGTELNEINRSAGVRAIPVNKELLEVLEVTKKVSEESHGALDPTFNVFWGLYNFKPGEEREPTDEEIRERLPLINFRNLVIDKKNRTAKLKKSGMRVGLGAVGQGYGVEKAVANLKKRGYKSGFVDGSGDSFFWGRKPDDSVWSVGIRSPFSKEKTLLRFYGTDVAVTTAGDDEKFFFKAGRRVHHIIDPRNGRPASKLRQVTVIGPSAFQADAYDTACFVLGLDPCQKLLKQKGLEAVIVTPDEKVHLTQGLKKKTNQQWGTYWTVDRL